MEKIKKYIKKFLELFKPIKPNYPYFWLVNQFGHISLSLALCYLTSLPYLVLAFWFIWEMYHLTKGADVIDFIEDLSFEWYGILLYVFFNKITVGITLIGIIIITFTKFKKDE